MFLNLTKLLNYSKIKKDQLLNPIDSGIICLKVISAYYGKDYPIDFLRENCIDIHSSMSLQDISILAERIGFKCTKIEINYLQLVEEVHFPVIIPWKQQYLVVLFDVKVNFWSFILGISKVERFVIADPMTDLIIVNKKTFLTNWIKEGNRQGVVLLLEPQIEFYENNTL
jgi:ATP-binding cassette, subfamily B, bacterial